MQSFKLSRNLACVVTLSRPNHSAKQTNTYLKAMRATTTLSQVFGARCFPPIAPIVSSSPLTGLHRLSAQHKVAGVLEYRNFSNSAALHKKKDKLRSSSSAVADDRALKDSPSSGDPYDLSRLHDGISTALSSLKDDLSKFRGGGRFDINAIESLRVQLSKATKETLRLGDLAQVIPKGGRMVTVLAAEEDVWQFTLPSWPFRHIYAI